MADAPSPKSLRLRVTALAIGVVVLAWVAAAAVAWISVRHEADELLDAYLVQTASVLHARLPGELDESELEHAPDLHRYARRVVFQVWDRDGRLGLHSTHAPDARLSPRDEGFDDVVVDGRRYRVFASLDRERRTLVQVAEQRRERDEIAAGVGRALGVPLAVALPLLAVALWLAVSAGMRPLFTLSREVAARDPGNLARVPDAGAPQEIAPLVASLNRLLDRVRDSLERERRFTADAAHELRTPVAALRVQAQVAARARSVPERERAIANVLAGCDRAARLVDQMLTLARVDTLDVPRDERCDLLEVARAVVAEHAPRAVERDVEIACEGPAAPVRGDAALLAILVRNLVDNALRHTRAGGAVRVATRFAPEGPELVVADTGAGVPDEVRGRLGERFFRPAGEEASGSGLGLSIVRRIAELHGARLRFDAPREGTGLVVTVGFSAPR